MGLRRFTDFILRGRWEAIVVAFLFSFVPLVGASLSIIVVTLVTLRKGAFEGTLVLCASLVPYSIGYAMMPVVNEAMLFATQTLIAINLLTWLFAVLLRRYANWNLVLEVAALIGLILVGVIHFIYPEVQNWWVTQLTYYMNKTTLMMGQLAPSADHPEKFSLDAVNSIKQYMTGLIMASIILNGLMQLLLGRWWQAVLFNPGGLSRELHQIRLSYVSVIVFIIVAVLAYFHNAVGLDVLPILIMVFFLAGLSLMHRLLFANRAGWLWLMLIYLSVIFLFPFGMMLVAVAGIIDSLLDLRKKLQK